MCRKLHNEEILYFLVEKYLLTYHYDCTIYDTTEYMNTVSQVDYGGYLLSDKSSTVSLYIDFV